MILNEKQQKSVSKFLSLILRHRPEQIGITLDKNGWVDIDILLAQVNHPKHNFTGVSLTYDTLMEIVETNDKNGLPYQKTANVSARLKVIPLNRLKSSTA